MCLTNYVGNPKVYSPVDLFLVFFCPVIKSGIYLTLLASRRNSLLTLLSTLNSFNFIGPLGKNFIFTLLWKLGSLTLFTFSVKTFYSSSFLERIITRFPSRRNLLPCSPYGREPFSPRLGENFLTRGSREKYKSARGPERNFVSIAAPDRTAHFAVPNSKLSIPKIALSASCKSLTLFNRASYFLSTLCYNLP